MVIIPHDFELGKNPCVIKPIISVHSIHGEENTNKIPEKKESHRAGLHAATR